MTRREAYDMGVEQLEAEGIENAECDIRILLEDLCGVDREELFIGPDKTISRRESEIFMNAVTRRMGHYPVQYITGKQDFMGLTFTVTPDVLIPRQDTEILVEEVLKELNDGSRILDMCTGSGCILLSLLYYSNDCEGVGVDVSEDALKVAKDNAGRLILDE
ncbi:MAG: HemK family protein methyltransferase, partial [Lachnospiraceae bacterium]|nr:HemK family protein methyltransferase [Lachnospiraceae bacterium]